MMCLASWQASLKSNDGYIDAFQGDGLIALFGAPNAHPNDPERAVLAAAEGLRAIEADGPEQRLSAERASRGKHRAGDCRKLGLR